MSTTAQRLVRDLGGPDRVHFMDQFTYAERATDWRSNNNIADSIYTQMHREAYPVPRYIVMSAGTGGTSEQHRPPWGDIYVTGVIRHPS